ncbi:MAG: TSUP family transporter, partial [Pseudomonadota bacterium]
MINELTMGGLLVSAAALFVGGFARGLTGFGNAAIIVTSLTFFLPPQQVVPLAIALEVIAGLMLLPSTTGAIHTSTLRTLLLGAALATPFGVLTLELVDADIL